VTRWLLILALIFTAPTWTRWVSETAATATYAVLDVQQKARQLRAGAQ